MLSTVLNGLHIFTNFTLNSSLHYRRGVVKIFGKIYL